LCLVVAQLSACGTVLPPLDEDGSAPVVDTGPPAEDADDDTSLPPDEDAGDPGAEDVANDKTIGDSDACQSCADVGPESGSPDVTGDGRRGDAAQLDAPASDAGRPDADGSTCPSPANCALPECNGVSCGANGLVCRMAACACPGGQAKETTCSDGLDNDCDGLKDCADPDCARLQCGPSTNQRCCGTTCANTETDPANCQGCGLACAAGHTCRRITDESGTRGHCTCAGTNSQCPGYPATVCRTNNNDGQDNLCACNFADYGHAGCAMGQICVDIAKANFCRY
jgi:hypothetical protein